MYRNTYFSLIIKIDFYKNKANYTLILSESPQTAWISILCLNLYLMPESLSYAWISNLMPESLSYAWISYLMPESLSYAWISIYDWISILCLNIYIMPEFIILCLNLYIMPESLQYLMPESHILPEFMTMAWISDYQNIHQSLAFLHVPAVLLEYPTCT